MSGRGPRAQGGVETVQESCERTLAPGATRGTRPIPILLYHSVHDEPPDDLLRWSVAPDTFARHLDLLGELGCTAWTMSDLVGSLAAGREPPERLCLVTFDDGYADFAEHALPRLQERAIPSTIYLTTGALGGVPDPVVPRMPIAPMLSLDDVPEVEARGVEIGAHSHSHWQLDAIPARLAREEILRSKQVLEERLGHAVQSFAYPHGYSSATVRDLVVRAGFSSAAAVRNAFSSVADNPFAIARLTVERGTTLATVRDWIAGRGAAVAASGELVRTQLWRWCRRAVTLREHPGRAMTQYVGG